MPKKSNIEISAHCGNARRHSLTRLLINSRHGQFFRSSENQFFLHWLFCNELLNFILLPEGASARNYVYSTDLETAYALLRVRKVRYFHRNFNSVKLKKKFITFIYGPFESIRNLFCINPTPKWRTLRFARNFDFRRVSKFKVCFFDIFDISSLKTSQNIPNKIASNIYTSKHKSALSIYSLMFIKYG